MLPCRGELSTQLSKLTAELSTLKTSFETMQDFVQLPLVIIWQQQLGNVMTQVLAQELSSLPHTLQAELRQQKLHRQALLQGVTTMTHHAQSATMSLPKKAPTMTHQLGPGLAAVPKQAALPDQARQHDTNSPPTLEGSSLSGPGCAPASLESRSAEELSDSAHKGRSGPAPGASLSDSQLSQQPADAESAMEQEVAHRPNEEQQDQASVSALPVEATPRPSSYLPSTARRASLPEQATYRGLPKQASPVGQPTFLRLCLAEVLRLTDPAQSQFQPMLCGWYTSGESFPPFLPACTPSAPYQYFNTQGIVISYGTVCECAAVALGTHSRSCPCLPMAISDAVAPISSAKANMSLSEDRVERSPSKAGFMA